MQNLWEKFHWTVSKDGSTWHLIDRQSKTIVAGVHQHPRDMTWVAMLHEEKTGCSGVSPHFKTVNLAALWIENRLFPALAGIEREQRRRRVMPLSE